MLVFRRATTWGVATLLLAVAGLAAFGILPAAAPAATSDVFPVLNVYQDDHLLGETDDVSLGLYDLDSAAETDSLTLSIPNGYGVALTHPVAYNLGSADVTTVASPGGKPTDYQGQVTVMDPATYAGNAGAQACAPGTHTAVWNLQALVPTSGKELDIPIAVDRAGKGYKLAMCFGDEHAQGAEVSSIFFSMNGVFRNPGHAGKYLFDASVTPFASDGSQSTSTAYELRGYEMLPQVLTDQVGYDPATKTLTVSGSLSAEGIPRGGINVHVFTGQTSDATVMKEIGVAVTAPNGKYTFSKRLRTAPKYLVGVVHHYQYATCEGSSPEPGGCASYTIDGRETLVTKVPLVKPAK